MKKTNRKGFTIVELVIVIAVIAILAAVLIPTFASLVKKANISADEQAVKQMNTALSIYTAENGAPTSVYKVREALSENDINADTLVPVTQGYAFYWDNENNKIVLVGEGKGTAKSGWVLLTSTGYGEAPNTAVTDVSSLRQAIEQSKTNATPVLVKLEQDITVSDSDKITTGNKSGVFWIEQGETLIIDANEHTFTSTAEGNLFRVEKGGQLIVKNATFETKFCAFRNGDGTLRLENVTINNTGKNACIHFAGLCDTYIANSKITNSGGYGIATNSSKAEDDGSRLTLVNTDVTTTAEGYATINITTYTNVSIEGGTISGKLTGISLRGCNATIKNTTITHDSSATGTTWGEGCNGPAADIVFACGGTSKDNFTGYITTANYVCEGVTASSVIVHNPKNEGTVNVSGIKVTHTCNDASGATCTGND